MIGIEGWGLLVDRCLRVPVLLAPLSRKRQNPACPRDGF
jgi:hypothetical protein